MRKFILNFKKGNYIKIRKEKKKKSIRNSKDQSK